MPTAATERGESHQRFGSRLFIVVSLVLIFLVGLLVMNLTMQQKYYSRGIEAALTDPKGPDHLSIIVYARASDFAAIKTSALFLSFILVFVGALYVLRVGESAFSLQVSSGQASGTLQSSSPGLVMITLGVVLIALTMYRDTSIKVTSSQDGDHVDSPSSAPISPFGPTKQVN